MEIREAYPEDTSTIVGLLKQSLGESLMPKSENYWNWKHVQNPFGASPVLLALEGSTLIGVRAFMRWQWQAAGGLYHAVRAVDTATHPDHQGKGIFKKLTLSLLDKCRASGDDFVFNTPNGQSKPGYLKMGWEEAGKVPISIHFSNPLQLALNRLSSAAPEQEQETSAAWDYWLSQADLPSFLTRVHESEPSWHTRYSVDYIRWRYRDNPVASYTVFGEETGGKITGLMVGRTKRSSKATEFRITDFFVVPGAGKKTTLFKQLSAHVRREKIDFCTLTGVRTTSGMAARRYFFLPAMGIGPMVTIRSINLDNSVQFRSFANWAPSLGDLELF